MVLEDDEEGAAVQTFCPGRGLPDPRQRKHDRPGVFWQMATRTRSAQHLPNGCFVSRSSCRNALFMHTALMQQARCPETGQTTSLIQPADVGVTADQKGILRKLLHFVQICCKSHSASKRPLLMPSTCAGQQGHDVRQSCFKRASTS